jgi:hypothetical protein
VLNCLLEKGLIQRGDGQFEITSINAAQLGEAVLTAVAADTEQQALYKTPGHGLRELLDTLQAQGLAQISFVGTAKYAAARPESLLQVAAVATEQLAAAQPPALLLPIPLPGAAAGAPAAAAASDAVQVDMPGPKTCSRGEGVFRLSINSLKAISGAVIDGACAVASECVCV